MASLRPGWALTSSLLSGASSARAPIVASCCRQLHASGARPSRIPRFSDKPLKDSGLDKPEKMQKFLNQYFPDLRPEDLEGYTKAQLEAIMAGEASIDRKDFPRQGRIRDDKGRIADYVDDFATIIPKVDLKPEAPWTRNRNVKWPTEEDEMKLFKGQNTRESPFGKKALNTYRRVAASRDSYRRDVREKELGTIIEAEATKLQGPERERFLQIMEQVKNFEGDELDLTTQDLEFMERYPDLGKKYILKEGEKRKFLRDLEYEPGSMFERQAMVAVLEDEARRLEAQGNLTEEQAALVKESRALARAKRDENRHLDQSEDIFPDISDLVLAPPLGKVPGVEGLYDQQEPDDSAKVGSGPTWRGVRRMTGMSVGNIEEVFTKILVLRFVTNQTRLGKVLSQSIMTMAGNGNGMIGVGMAKSSKDANSAVLASKMLAIRNMRPIRRYENRTLYGNVKGKVSGTVVELRTRPPGYGLRVPYLVYEMCRAAGLHDISGVIPRSTNPMNVVKATLQCFTNQRDPEEIAIGRGKKLVDVRKVYYGGTVY